MSNPITKSKFAELIKVSAQYMPKIVDRLTMVSVPGKKKLQIDLHGADTLRFLKDREIEIAEQVPINKAPATTAPPATRPSSGLGNNSSGTSNDDSDPEGFDPESKKELEKRKLKLSSEKLQLEIDQKRGNLVEKNLTDILFGKMYQIDSDQLKQLGSNLSPKLFRIISERNKIKTNEICKLLDIDDKVLKDEIESTLNSGEKEIKTKIVGTFEESVHAILKSIKDEIDNFLDLLEADAI